MCPDNPTIQNKPDDLTSLVNEEIGAFVQGIFAHENWHRLRRRYPGYPDLELLKMVALQTELLVLLEDRHNAARDLQTRYMAAREKEFAR